MKNNIEILLKTLRLENFKSYKDVTEIGPFHNKLNAIIGSNGSGKSNFLDAILFVLGKKALKIRFNRLSEIINISNFYSNEQSLVTLVFNKNSGKIFSDLFFSNEINISRQIFKNNISILIFI
jgi:structural maintenance of chromosome 4